MEIHVTNHAAEQYIRRHAPELTLKEALARLSEMAESAHRGLIRTHQGDPVWMADGVALVTRFDHNSRAHIVVTVLPAGSYTRSLGDPDAEIRAEADTDRAERLATLRAEKIDPEPAAHVMTEEGREEQQMLHARKVLEKRFTKAVSKKQIKLARRIFDARGLPLPEPRGTDEG